VLPEYFAIARKNSLPNSGAATRLVRLRRLLYRVKEAGIQLDALAPPRDDITTRLFMAVIILWQRRSETVRAWNRTERETNQG